MLGGTVRSVVLRIKSIELYMYWFPRFLLFLFLTSLLIQFFSGSFLCISSYFLESAYRLEFIVANSVEKLGFYFIKWLFEVLFLRYLILIQSFVPFCILLLRFGQKLLQLLLRTGFPVRTFHFAIVLFGRLPK